MQSRRRFLRTVVAGTAAATLTPRRPGQAQNAAGAPLDAVSQATFPFFGYVATYSIGELMPKDQGGKFIQMDVFGTEDDAEIVRAIRRGRLHEVYGDPLGWSRFERTAIEKSVWLNRFYWLSPFARLYYLTGDTRYTADMMALLTRWVSDNPLRPDSPRTTYNWRDMQVAWRAIHLSWCYHLGSRGLTESDRGTIARVLQQHADVLLAGFGSQPLSEFNHQSHGALAMLYLGILFPSISGAAALRERGRVILSHHVARAFHADGGNVEQMFGYYPFVAHVFRDAYLLCTANGVPPPAGLLPLLDTMAVYLSTVAQPDGRLPAVNDSFDMPTGATVATLCGIVNRPCGPMSASRFFQESQIAVMKSPVGPWHVLANPAVTIGAHAHAGRLGFTLWHGDRPVFVDSGCSNYDDPMLVTWYRTSRAHNTAIIDGADRDVTSGHALWAAARATNNRIVDWHDTDELTYCRMTSPADEPDNAGVAWSRSLILVKGRYVVIYDEFDGRGRHRYDLLFHVAAGEALNHQRREYFVVGSGNRTGLFPARPDLVTDTTVIGGHVSVNGVSTPAPVACVSLEGAGTLAMATVILPVGNSASRVRVTERNSTAGVEVRIRDDAGRTSGVLIRRSKASGTFRGRRVDGPVVAF